MENENKVESLDNNEVEKVTGGIGPLVREKGYYIKSVCYKCKREFKKYVNPMDELRHGMTGCPPMCHECRRKRYEELEQKNQKFKVDVKEFLKEVEKSTNR